MPYSALHAAARAYAEAGWPVFPCRENGKEPACLNGFKDATTNLKTIDFWWKDDDFNIGFCPENVGLCIVDEDTDKGGCFEQYSPGHLPTVISPHGRHFYFAGSLPPTASRIGRNIDTRGRQSYVLVPPSVVDGSQYVFTGNPPTGPWDLDEVPQRIIKLCNTTAEPRNRPEPIKTIVTDRPQAITLFKRYLKRNPIPPEGAGSDDAVYRAIARGRDLGLSDIRIVCEIETVTGFDPDWIEGKLKNVETYGQNEPGCDIPLTATEANRGLIERFVRTDVPDSVDRDEPTDTGLESWSAHFPRPQTEMPEQEYFDADKFLPKSPDGAIGFVYGKSGDHKTNTVLSMLDASSAERILYAAGEGAFGLERDRIGERTEFATSGRITVLPRVPLLGQIDEVQSFIAANEWFRPEVVVLDTWANAIGGEDDNSSSTAFHVTDNGSVGVIKKAWKCLVIIIDHEGKDSTRGQRGSSAKMGNVDFSINVTADKSTGLITAAVKKMRDGYDGGITHWLVSVDPNVVPVPVKISDAEYAKLVIEAKPKDKGIDNSLIVKSFLRLNGHHDWDTGIETKELATLLTEQERGPFDPLARDEGAWRTSQKKWEKALDTARRTKKWTNECTDEQFFNGGDKMTLRWFCPPQDQGDTAEC